MRLLWLCEYAIVHLSSLGMDMNLFSDTKICDASPSAMIQVGPTEDDYVICREGYVNAAGLLKHLDNVGAVFEETLKYADVVDLMCQGPAAELEKLKEPLADLERDLGLVYYPLAEGSLRSK